ncbi:HD domain-containing protein [Elizabethkingia anophelis]|jgi:predicted metal-dependent HD superfamily phosphohydrolase|uniref:HD domain-containing protein n=1 Tax=Elizabethkingia anophelis TaxID=1117645 RepID=UPI0021A4CD5C|nr:HD domain-containing protein [Elizabethkingia anophelis]MDV4069958.1 hypothetical protein [Elizabethkingia anophelis]
MNDLISIVGSYVQHFLVENLSPELGFHSLAHTREVVEAAWEIGQHSKLDAPEMEILIIAAWFHDCGYVFTYTGHEEESKRIAGNFLQKLGVSSNIILPVLCCIEATKFPQFPRNQVEGILCDADLYHLAKPGYPRYAKLLREEFGVFLKRTYSDEEWQSENCLMLSNHCYWTVYGKTILERFKQVNMDLMDCSPANIDEPNN